MTTVLRALPAVYAHVARCLQDHPLALEALELYETETIVGRTDLPRLRGFLQGLYVGGVLSFHDHFEVSARLENL